MQGVCKVLYTTIHTKKGDRRRVSDSGDQPWWHRLPAQWRDMVVAPLAFDLFREPELDAERVFGYDPDGKACYYAHRYLLREPRSDDGEEFYAAAAYAESVTAWLLRDERWLIHRCVHVDDDFDGRGFYSFSEHMPR